MQQLTVRDLVRMPWTYRGPMEIIEDGAPHFELTIAELPDFFLAARTREEVLDGLRDALRTFLNSYLERNETPPLPASPGLWNARVQYISRKAAAEAHEKLAVKLDRPASTFNGDLMAR